MGICDGTGVSFGKGMVVGVDWEVEKGEAVLVDVGVRVGDGEGVVVNGGVDTL
jgi:hypothetical protein